jgi:hypothetical protein
MICDHKLYDIEQRVLLTPAPVVSCACLLLPVWYETHFYCIPLCVWQQQMYGSNIILNVLFCSAPGHSYINPAVAFFPKNRK